MKLERMQKLISLMEKLELVGMAFNPGPTMTYLTDLHFHLMERPTILLITQTGSVAMILPVLEKGKLPGESDVFHTFSYSDDPNTWATAFEQASEWLNFLQGKLGVAPNRFRFLEMKFLEAAMPGIEIIDGSQVIEGLRIVKDVDEIDKMKKAAQIAQEALLATLKNVVVGMTEKAIANELIIQLLKAGSNPEMPFSPIVAIGENSANPHAVPTERPLHSGDLLLIDWGAGFKGYFSDITRTFTFGAVDKELLRIGEIVLEANRAGREAGKPGLDAGTVDRAARSVITDAGYSHAFIHRTGHGLGMEAHEPPYIFAENDMILTPGMTFTVEPGIYLPGKGGVRIEDDVVMTSSGVESLTDLPRAVSSIEELSG